MAFKSDIEAIVLGLLQHESLHGYEITKRMRELEIKVISMAESQLYPILHKLELSGQIEAVWIPQEGKPARKVYSITREGVRILDSKRSEWASFSKVVSSVLASDKVAKEAHRG